MRFEKGGRVAFNDRPPFDNGQGKGWFRRSLDHRIGRIHASLENVNQSDLPQAVGIMNHVACEVVFIHPGHCTSRVPALPRNAMRR